MVTKRLNEGSFKCQKLEKSKRRKRALESERRQASLREGSRRNDLLPDLSILVVEIKSLERSPRRARVTTPEQLERTTASIVEHGFVNPILTRGSEVIDGEVRLDAAEKLGMERVSAIDCTHLSDEQVRTLRLATNRIAELGVWDLEKLKMEFAELIDLDVDLSVTGFTDAEVGIILLDDEPAEEKDESEDSGAEPVSRLGDIWHCKDHRVICANSLEKETYERLLEDEAVDCVLMDPPYNVKIEGNVSGLGKKVHDEFVMASGELDDAQWQQFLDTLFMLLASFLAVGAVVFSFMDWRSIHRVYAAGFAAKLKLINLVVWYKQSGGMGSLYRSSHEEVAVFCNGDKPHTNSVELGRHGRDRQNVWCAPGANRRGSSANLMLGSHATPKPVELCVDAILDVTKRGHSVLDAFLGSGTTLIAAEKTGRRCRGIELEPKFVDVSLRRWMEHTGKQAVLAESGETFDQEPAALDRDIKMLASENFLVFAMLAFRMLHDEPFLSNWHVGAIAHSLQGFYEAPSGRLVITMPPRTMKSFLGSVCLPAWLLGRNPGEKIICASYSHDLSHEFAFQMRRLMETQWYKSVFPATHIDRRKSGVGEIATTKGGHRLSTSVGGTLTGRGGQYIIIDDPIKAGDAHSEVVRESAVNWYRGSVTSRLNNPRKGKILVIAQRLHLEDLPGQLLAGGGWDHLDLPLISWQEQEIALFPGKSIIRPAGHNLHDERFSDVEIARLRVEMGEQDFEAQYNQRPLPPGGALFKLEWLKRYDERPEPYEVEGIFQSWDTAYQIAEGNDYSVCTTWALSGKRCFLLDIYRERLEFPDLKRAVYAQRHKWKADLVIVEYVGSGTSLVQNIRNGGRNMWLSYLRPLGSKQDRASQQSPKIERGEVWLPRTAPWLKTFEDEYIAFPHSKFDDQIDSMVQFLAAVGTGDLLRKADMARRR